MSGVNNLSRAAGKASSAVGQLAGAFGGLNGSAGKAVGAVSSLVGALSTGGIFGLAIAGVTALVSAFNSYKEKQEQAAQAAKEHAEKIRKLQEEAARTAWKNFVDDLSKGRIEADKLAASLDKVIRLNREIASAKQANSTSKIGIEQAKIAAETATNVMNADTDEGKAVAQAEGNLKSTQLRGKVDISNAEAALKQMGDDATKLDESYNKLLGAHDDLEREIIEQEETWK